MSENIERNHSKKSLNELKEIIERKHGNNEQLLASSLSSGQYHNTMWYEPDLTPLSLFLSLSLSLSFSLFLSLFISLFLAISLSLSLSLPLSFSLSLSLSIYLSLAISLYICLTLSLTSSVDDWFVLLILHLFIIFNITYCNCLHFLGTTLTGSGTTRTPTTGVVLTFLIY